MDDNINTFFNVKMCFIGSFKHIDIRQNSLNIFQTTLFDMFFYMFSVLFLDCSYRIGICFVGIRIRFSVLDDDINVFHCWLYNQWNSIYFNFYCTSR